MNMPQDFLENCYQCQIRTGLEITKTWLEGAGRVRTRQLAAIKAALDDCEHCSAELADARRYEELLLVHQKLACAHALEVAGYWSGLFQAGCENFGAMLDRIRAQSSQMSASVQAALGVVSPPDTLTAEAGVRSPSSERTRKQA